MKARPFYFEIKDMLTQFVAAFDDIVIGRFNKERKEKDKINVRYVYAPKQRVLYDIINESKTLTLPVVSVNVTNISRDQNRVFNKLDGFYYQANVGEEKVSRHIKSPVPVNITLSVSVLTRYQTDMDQILSNFVPFCNPYVIISWKIPEKFKLSVDQEIRSEVLWTGDVSMNYPTELNSSQKARVTADTSFTIKGWLFKDLDQPAGNIFFIDTDLKTETQLEYYDNFESLSGNTYTPPVSTGLESRTSSFEVSGSPFITDIFYNGILLQDDLTITSNTSGNIILNGYGFNHTKTVLFSTNNESVYTNLTSISDFSRQEAVSGQSIPFTILNDNTIIFNSPLIVLDDNSVTSFAYSQFNGFINESNTYTKESSLTNGRPRYSGSIPARDNLNFAIFWNGSNWVSQISDANGGPAPSTIHNDDTDLPWLNLDGTIRSEFTQFAPVVPVASKLRFIPLNKAGYDLSDLSYMSTLCGRGLSSTFIIVE